MFSHVNHLAFLLLSILFFAAERLALAQQQAPRTVDGGARQEIVSIYISSIPNAPFTATLSTEWDRTYTDGTTVTLKSRRLIARDASGRIFQERRVAVPDDGKNEARLLRTEISDPNQHTVYFCVEEERVCQIRSFAPISLRGFVSGSAEAGSNPAEMQPLGKQTIAGVETEGWQGSDVIPAHTVGNDSPILSKREFWYSAKLGFNLLSIRQDPRFGLEKFEVTEITLRDPDPKFFEPASGFAIVDTRKAESEKQPPASN